MTLPIAYMAPKDWYKAYLIHPETVEIEGMESFEKQTFRNRCLISTPDGPLTLSVPVKKVEHKQLTRDMEISYQTRWQHQHWISLVSAYKHTPFFGYYEDYFKPFYEKEYRFLWDLNSEIHETVMALLRNLSPTLSQRERVKFAYKATEDWRGEELNRFFGDGKSILDELFEFGPETTDHLR